MATELIFKLVKDASGKVMVEESAMVARRAIEDYAARRETEEGDIALAVETIFDQYPGTVISRKALIGNTMILLKVQPGAYVHMEQMVDAYLDENLDRVENAKKGIVGEPPRTRKFGRKGGPTGGLFRWSDIPRS